MKHLPKIDLSVAWSSGHRIIDSVIARLPNLIMAAILFILIAIMGAAAKRLVRRGVSRRKRRQSIGILLGQLTQMVIVIVGFLIALSIIAPSFQAADLIKILGIGSVAIGFAFQNILQNFLAGILLLLNEPFRVGDVISVTGLEGRVDDIQARATIVTAQNGRRLVIPNATLFTNPVAVDTSAESNLGKAEQGQDSTPKISESPH